MLDLSLEPSAAATAGRDGGGGGGGEVSLLLLVEEEDLERRSFRNSWLFILGSKDVLCALGGKELMFCLVLKKLCRKASARNLARLSTYS